MNTVTVNASKSYTIYIGNDLLSQAGAMLRPLCQGDKAVIVSDSQVGPLYAQRVQASLEKAGFQVFCFVFPAGEESKNMQTYGSILHFLAQCRLSRKDLLVALGGGVTGDMTGFAAATYMRGIPYVQIPTSLLAMVDSSVGGKTAIDLPAGKNLVGAFYQPVCVLCDLDTLATLPRKVFLDGCAEVIKYGVLFDEALFNHLEQFGPEFDRLSVITRCIELKKQVVMADEFENGPRQLLNLGHTVGHAIEGCSHYQLSHGQAVAAGMAIVARIAASQGLCSAEVAQRIGAILQKFSLPTTAHFSAAELAQAALSDKKRSGGFVNLILPLTIGSCSIEKTPVSRLTSLLEAGL